MFLSAFLCLDLKRELRGSVVELPTKERLLLFVATQATTDQVTRCVGRVFFLNCSAQFFHRVYIFLLLSLLERTALRALYTATQGPAWQEQRGWETNDPDLSTWHGVVCGEGGHVTALKLKSNNLHGEEGNGALINLCAILDGQRFSICFLIGERGQELLSMKAGYSNNQREVCFVRGLSGS